MQKPFQQKGTVAFRRFDSQKDISTRLAKRAFSVYKDLGLDSPRAVAKSRFDMGGSHTTVTYPPLFALRPASSSAVWRCNSLKDLVDFYAHVAFCEALCTFCSYDVETSFKNEGRVGRYLEALEKEIAFCARKFAEAGSSLNSLFIGGGTPTVLSQAQLSGLIEFIMAKFDVKLGMPFCVESSPLTVSNHGGREKLAALKALGVTRLSMGVQSFDSSVIKNVARKYSGELAAVAVAAAMEFFGFVNIDMIQGLRGQTLASIEQDLEVIALLKPPSVTWYNQRVTNYASDHTLMLERGGEYFDETASLVARIMIFERMKELGYAREYGDKFVLASEFSDGFKRARSSVATDFIGVGSSAYSHANGFFFRNARGFEQYVGMVERSGSAVAHALALTPEEQFAGLLVHGIKYGVDLESVYSSIGGWRAAHFMRKHRIREKTTMLEHQGLITVNGSLVQLTEKGVLFENEISRMFYSPAVEALLEAKNAGSQAQRASWIHVAVAALIIALSAAGIAKAVIRPPAGFQETNDLCQPFTCGT